LLFRVREVKIVPRPELNGHLKIKYCINLNEV